MGKLFLLSRVIILWGTPPLCSLLRKTWACDCDFKMHVIMYYGLRFIRRFDQDMLVAALIWTSRKILGQIACLWTYSISNHLGRRAFKEFLLKIYHLWREGCVRACVCSWQGKRHDSEIPNEWDKYIWHHWRFIAFFTEIHRAGVLVILGLEVYQVRI